jgi:hypothetical protein
MCAAIPGHLVVDLEWALLPTIGHLICSKRNPGGDEIAAFARFLLKISESTASESSPSDHVQPLQHGEK